MLTEDNFDEAINHFKFIMVLFYKEDCSDSEQIIKAFSSITETLSRHDSSFKMGHVDTTKINTKNIQKKSWLTNKIEDIQNFQGDFILKFFISGIAIDYSGPLNEDDIIR